VLVAGLVPHDTYWLLSGLFVQLMQAVLLVVNLYLPVPHAMHCWICTLELPWLTETIGVPSGRSVPAGQFAHCTFSVLVPKQALGTPRCGAHFVLSAWLWPWHHRHCLKPIWSEFVQLTYVPAAQVLVAHTAQAGSLEFVLASVL
jgi:hypothetical protein